jgi:hypothetical protein
MSFSLTSRHSRRAAVLLAGVGAVVALPLMTASTSSAATGTCGAEATALVSIHYKACVEKLASRVYDAHFLYGNNHGSAASISTQYGWKVDGHSYWETDSITLKANPSDVEREEESESCAAGQKIIAIVRVKQSNGDWGPTASSATYTCS